MQLDFGRAEDAEVWKLRHHKAKSNESLFVNRLVHIPTNQSLEARHSQRSPHKPVSTNARYRETCAQKLKATSDFPVWRTAWRIWLSWVSDPKILRTIDIHGSKEKAICVKTMVNISPTKPWNPMDNYGQLPSFWPLWPWFTIQQLWLGVNHPQIRKHSCSLLYHLCFPQIPQGIKQIQKTPRNLWSTQPPDRQPSVDDFVDHGLQEF